jgi:hypothetical protein
MSESADLMRMLSREIEEGNFEAITQLRGIMIEEGLNSQPLIDKLIFEGESKYLKMCCQENKGKEAIYLSSCYPDELMDVMKLISVHFRNVLKSELKKYTEASPLETILNDVSDSCKKDNHYVGIYLGKSPSLIVSRGENLYLYASLELEHDSPYNSLLVFADELTTERVAQYIKDNEKIKVVDRYDRTECEEVPAIDEMCPFGRFIESADHIRV